MLLVPDSVVGVMLFNLFTLYDILEDIAWHFSDTYSEYFFNKLDLLGRRHMLFVEI